MKHFGLLELDYPEAFHESYKLFGEGIVQARLPRLNEIYRVTEEKWEENLQRLVANNVKTKYLLIGEAAPWSDEGQEITYFYNGKFKGLGGAILPGLSINEWDAESIYNQVAKKQFVLIDSLPFSFSYKPSIRTRYQQMMRECLGYFQGKLFDPRLQWEDDVKVGFGYALSATAFMRIMDHELTLPNGQIIGLNENMIVADKSGFPHTSGFKRVFGL